MLFSSRIDSRAYTIDMVTQDTNSPRLNVHKTQVITIKM